ncbi:MAG: DinB family protein [Armatimonadetes bacterium]|nr:DinB family protein [Armatimonadota bacterium]
MSSKIHGTMSDFSQTYELARKRFDDCVAEFSTPQLNYRLGPDTLTVGEMALHLSGVEIWFVSQLLGRELGAEEQQLASAATEGVVNDHPFPFSEAEITVDLVRTALAKGREMVMSIILSPTEEVLNREIKSALGPVITGAGALARFAFHPAYHHGQAYLIQHSTGFPKS